MPKIRPSTFSCIQCRGSAECAFGFDIHSTTKCKGKVQLGSEESCYIYHENSKLNPQSITRSSWDFDVNRCLCFLLDDNWIERGCTVDRKQNLTLENDKNLIECNASGCNTNNVIYSNCVYCDSQEDAECYALSNPKKFTKQCFGTYTYSKRGCYTVKIGMEILSKHLIIDKID